MESEVPLMTRPDYGVDYPDNGLVVEMRLNAEVTPKRRICLNLLGSSSVVLSPLHTACLLQYIGTSAPELLLLACSCLRYKKRPSQCLRYFTKVVLLGGDHVHVQLELTLCQQARISADGLHNNDSFVLVRDRL